MPGIVVRRKHGPRSHEVVEAIVGGQLVEGRASSKVGVAAAGSKRVLGVAIADAVPASTFNPGLVNGVLNAAPQPNRVGLASRGDEVPVTYAAAATFGQKLKAGATGKVTPVVDGDDAQLIVGKCIEPAGVTTVNAVGYMEVL